MKAALLRLGNMTLSMLLLIAYASAIRAEPVCPLDDKRTLPTFLAHPSDCQMFFMCANGIAIAMHCSSNLLWNNESASCDFPARTKCLNEPHITSTTNAIAETSSCESGKYYSDPSSDCATFYRCESGVLGMALVCAHGFHWNQQRQRCDIPTAAKCANAKPGRLLEDGAINFKCPLYDDPMNPTHLRHPRDCTKFLKCSFGRAWIFDCPWGLQWSVEMNRCEYPYYVRCVIDAEEENTATIEALPIASVTTDEGSQLTPYNSHVHPEYIVEFTIAHVPQQYSSYSAEASILSAAYASTLATTPIIIEETSSTLTSVGVLITKEPITDSIPQYVSTITGNVVESSVLDTASDLEYHSVDATLSSAYTTESLILRKATESVLETTSYAMEESATSATKESMMESIPQQFATTTESVADILTNSNESTALIDVTSLEHHTVESTLTTATSAYSAAVTSTTELTIISEAIDATLDTTSHTIEETSSALAEPITDCIPQYFATNTEHFGETFMSTSESLSSNNEILSEYNNLESTLSTATSAYSTVVQRTTESSSLSEETAITHSTIEETSPTLTLAEIFTTTESTTANIPQYFSTSMENVDVTSMRSDDSFSEYRKVKSALTTSLTPIYATEVQRATELSTSIDVTESTLDTTPYMATTTETPTLSETTSTVDSIKENQSRTKQSTTNSVLKTSPENLKALKPLATFEKEATVASTELSESDELNTIAIILQTTKATLDTILAKTTQDPRLPFTAPECEGANNLIRFPAAVCSKYYQCVNGYAYLLNCFDGYAFSDKQMQCISSKDCVS